MTATAWLAVVALLLFAVTLLALVALVPEWVRERRRSVVLAEKLEEARRLLAGSQAQHETARQALIRCREQVIARNLEELRKADAVDVANQIIAGKKPPDAP